MAYDHDDKMKIGARRAGKNISHHEHHGNTQKFSAGSNCNRQSLILKYVSLVTGKTTVTFKMFDEMVFSGVPYK